MGHRKTIKVGDRVRRTRWDFGGMAVGDEDVVTHINRHDAVTLKRYGAGHSQGSLELVRNNGGPYTPGIDGEVLEAERRSARLRALRKLANDLGYTLVKNAA